MNPHSSLPPRWIWLVGPSLVSIALYWVAFHLPLSRASNQELAKLNRLSLKTSRGDCEADARRLAALQEQSRWLAEQLESQQTGRTHLVARRNDLSHAILGSAEPATALADAIGILERHQLRCLSAQPLPNATSKLPDALQAITQQTANRAAVSDLSSEVRLEVHGTFQDMQHALDELKATAVGVRLVALEMNLIEGHSGLLDWFITVAVRSNLP